MVGITDIIGSTSVRGETVNGESLTFGFLIGLFEKL